MAETLIISADKTDKSSVYEQLYPQLQQLLAGELDEIACMANTAAALNEVFDFLWIGFYRVVGDELVLGPFQGPIACTRITKGRGVCGTAWLNNETVIVPDVDAFPGHISCSSQSRSELVIPLLNNNGTVMAVLDVDSTHLNYFDERDRFGLEKICKLVATTIYP